MIILEPDGSTTLFDNRFVGRLRAVLFFFSHGVTHGVDGHSANGMRVNNVKIGKGNSHKIVFG